MADLMAWKMVDRKVASKAELLVTEKAELSAVLMVASKAALLEL